MAINYGKQTAEFTPKAMPERDRNAPVIDMNFNGLNTVVRSHTDRIAAVYSSLESLAKQIAGASGGAVGANPTGTVGLAAVNGSAPTFLRSDGAPALSQAITPTWSALHTFTLAPKVTAFAGTGDQMVYADSTGQTGVQAIPGTVPGDISLKSTSTAPSGYTYTGQIVSTVYSWVVGVVGHPVMTTLSDMGYASNGRLVYFISGNTGGAVTTSVTSKNMDTLVSTSLTGMTAGRRNGAAACDGTYIYYSGGYSDLAGTTATQTLYRYNIAANTWATMANVPRNRARHAMVYYSGKLYCFGGVDNTPALIAITDIYDIATDAWSTGASLSTARKDCVAVVTGAYVCVFGGNDTAATVSLSAVNEQYDIAGNSFSTKTAMPQATTQHTGLGLGNLAYCVGGAYNAAGALKSTRRTFIFDRGSNVWYQGMNLNVPKYSAGIGMVDSDIIHGMGLDTGGTRGASFELGVFPTVPAYVMSKN